MEGEPTNEKGAGSEQIKELSLARKKVADLLGYNNVQEMFQVGLLALRAKILIKLKDIRETFDLLEDDPGNEDEVNGEEKKYRSQFNNDFRELYHSAVSAKLIKAEDLEAIYPGVPDKE